MVAVRTLLARRPDIVGLGAAAMGLVASVAFTDDSAWWHCPIRGVTGYLCPGCGMQRAIAALLHGDLPGAVTANATIVIGPALIALAFRTKRHGNHAAMWAVVAVSAVYVIVYTVMRNM
jgi:hypothetical protein